MTATPAARASAIAPEVAASAGPPPSACGHGASECEKDFGDMAGRLHEVEAE